MRRHGWRFPSPLAILIVILCLIWGTVFVLNLAPILRGGFGWEWNFKPELSRYRVTPLAFGLILYVTIGLWLRRRRSSVPLVAWSILGAVGLSLATIHVRGDVLYRLYSITVSGRTGGWHMASTRIQDLAWTLANWPQFMEESTAFSSHLGTSPPGMVLVYYSTASLLERLPGLASQLALPVRGLLCQYLGGYSPAEYASGWLGVLMPVWGGLTILPLHALAQRVYGETAARWTALWWPLVPSVLMFTPLPNVFYPLPALIVVAMLWRGLRRNHAGWVLGSGMLMSLLTFLTFTFLPLLVFCGLLTLGAYWIHSSRPRASRPTWRWPLLMGAAFAIGFSTVWLIFYAISAMGLPSVLRAAAQTQASIVRPYLPWLALHLNDFFMFSGWTFALLAVVASWRAGRRLLTGAKPTQRDIFALAFVSTLVILDLSGTLRGESGRVLSLMAPFLLLAAADTASPDPAGTSLVTGTQAVLTLGLVVCLPVVGTEFKAHAAPVPPAVKLAASAPTVHSSGARFGPFVQLISYSGKVDSQIDAQGNQQAFMYLWLTWNTGSYLDTQLAYEVQPFAADQAKPENAAVLAPFGDQYPTTCWKPSDTSLTDRVKVPLSSSWTGQWWASLALVDPGGGEPLAVLLPDGAQATSVRLGPFLPLGP